MTPKCLFLISIFVYVPVDLQVTTETTQIWVSCKECTESFMNTTFDFRCKFGCDKYFRQAAPVSITKPTPVSHTKSGSYLDCKDCFGHGLDPTADPRCKYGCGRFMTYPRHMSHLKITETESSDNDFLQSEDETTVAPLEHVQHGGNQINIESSDAGSHKHAAIKYKNLSVFIVLFVGIIATIIGFLFYRYNRWHKICKRSSTSNNVAIVMREI